MAAKFTVVKKGYDQTEVDFYIQKLEQELSEYREKENAISNALICAESASRQTIKQAEKKSRIIIEEARNELQEEISIIEKMIATEKRALEDFCAEYDSVVKNYFIGNAFEITAPLREKLNLMECLLAESKTKTLDPAEGSGAKADNQNTE